MSSERRGVLDAVKRRPDVRWEALVIGDVLESPGITISEAHLIQWAGLTGDWVSLHLDADYAAETPFGERISHGPLTLSLALGLLTQTGYFSNVAAWLGVDEVRAHAPVLIGDTIRVRATVSAARPTKKAERGLWSLAYEVINQNRIVVMTFSSSFLVLTDAALSIDAALAARL
jgi:acyl dehydratase